MQIHNNLLKFLIDVSQKIEKFYKHGYFYPPGPNIE